MGPVTPLIATASAFEKLWPGTQIVWVGTPQGPEGELLENLGYRFIPVKTAKLPRYASLSIATAPFVLMRSYLQAREIIHQEKPDLVMSAGGYVSVPFVWAARTMKLPTWIHQQDLRPGLANKMMAPFATRISTAWEKDVEAFSKDKTSWIGNPVRENLQQVEREKAVKDWGVNSELPTMLVLGGGTGACWINDAVQKVGPKLLEKMNVIHLYGRHRQGPLTLPSEELPGKYVARDFIFDMDKAYAAADLIVSRAGMGTISELAFLSKPSVIIPIPNSHQEDNTAILKEADAAVVFEQTQPVDQLVKIVTKLLQNKERSKQLGDNLHKLLPTYEVAMKIAEQARELIKR